MIKQRSRQQGKMEWGMLGCLTVWGLLLVGAVWMALIGAFTSAVVMGVIFLLPLWFIGSLMVKMERMTDFGTVQDQILSAVSGRRRASLTSRFDPLITGKHWIYQVVEKEDVATVMEKAKSLKSWERFAAATLLGTWRQEEGIPVLRELMEDDVLEVAVRASWALSLMGAAGQNAMLEGERPDCVHWFLRAVYARRGSEEIAWEEYRKEQLVLE